MNDNELVNDTDKNVNTYRATTNLNTAIENPQLNINSAIGVNIQDSVDNNTNNSSVNNYQGNNFSSNNYTDNNEVDSTVTSFIDANNSVNNVNLPTDNSVNNTIVSNSVNNNHENYAATGDVSNNYAPTMEGKKRKGFNITISKELKMMIFIIFILVIFVMTIPSIYDFFKDLGLVITG